ncbi:MAG: malto-oligosyltrehalose synthase [Bacteroidota bacterium]|nr:malto-oligosyltrehalose synthase [Bacteroidota bacterium]
MYIPSSTYRLQVTKSFNFENLKKNLNYLHRLGISTIYSAPFFEARPGSTHGYDVTDSHILNPEIGTMVEFKALSEDLRKKGMGWLQDIVPNHMAFDPGNPLLMDVFEKGRKSNFFQYFDINWEHADPKYKNKVMAPFLGKPLNVVIKNEELKLDLFQESFYLRYYETRYPVSISSYHFILKQANKIPVWANEEYTSDYQNLILNFENLEEIDEPNLYTEYTEKLKKEFAAAITDDEEIHSLLSAAVSNINKNKKLLAQLLDHQNFFLSYWKDTEQEINYRRFFTVNDLICLNIQNEEVFHHYHQFIYFLYTRGMIQGLRIDHIDGLLDPTQYINRLREKFGEEAYIVVEKILEWEENLPASWPIQGTSGYHFLACISHLYTDHKNRNKFSEIYREITKSTAEYENLVRDKKHFIITKRMFGELNNLMQLLEVSDLMPLEEEIDPGKLREALGYLLVFYPVYRVYGNKLPLNEEDLAIIQNALQKAVDHAPYLSKEIDYLRKLLNGKADGNEEYNNNKLFFMMRCQQIAGPLAAKGVEDTVFYIYNRLISHNEVGDSPHIFGISTDEFHKKMLDRLNRNPLAINTTATHDTKRGEDARVRINALSEIPEEWEAVVKQWKSMNKNLLTTSENGNMPTANDEYFIYQTLVGAFPMNGEQEEDNLQERVKEYMIKVVREAKVNTSWADPKEEYENAVVAFIESILKNQEFLDSFVPFMQKIARYGAIYSLAQALIKITAPGIPDIYQGCELWDLSMVDPDNRRPVDYELRNKHLDVIEENGKDPEFREKILRNPEDGLIKMFTIFKALNFRKEAHDLFSKGNYIPLVFEGRNANHAFGFVRKRGTDWSLIVVPGLLVKEDYLKNKTPDFSFWQETKIILPEEAPFNWRNIFTDQEVNIALGHSLQEIFGDFPVVLLEGILE